MPDEHDFAFLDKHVEHLVQHPYAEQYLYDPVHHFIVNKHVVAHQFDGFVSDNVILASAHIDLGSNIDLPATTDDLVSDND